MELGQKPTAVLPTGAPQLLGVLHGRDKLVHRHPGEVHPAILTDTARAHLSTDPNFDPPLLSDARKLMCMTSDKARRRSAVFSVHASKPDDIGAIEVVFDNERAAEEFAAGRSKDPGVLSASVTRYFVGELGTRRPISWFVDGVEQPRRFDRQPYPTDGRDDQPTGPDTRQQRGETSRPEA
ncbi:hypothetical protein WHI96_27515 [Pseudonocardia tropica]|uniref:Uncharacterized protein n=1 Tax=Pseudonocardia tropica TaxID=681289 RepID=A0ABV1K2U5_9PSEU